MAQAEVEAKNQQIQLLENESRRWQERNAQLLTKVLPNVHGGPIICKLTVLVQYDRIDPAELQSVKDELEKVQAENKELKEAAEKDTAAHLAKV